MKSLLCAWCVENPAVRMEMVDGRLRPVCSVHGAKETHSRTEMTERVVAHVAENPGCTGGDIRRALRLDTEQANRAHQSLRAMVKSGKLRRTGGDVANYQYWPVAKKEAA